MLEQSEIVFRRERITEVSKRQSAALDQKALELQAKAQSQVPLVVSFEEARALIQTVYTMVVVQMKAMSRADLESLPGVFGLEQLRPVPSAGFEEMRDGLTVALAGYEKHLATVKRFSLPVEELEAEIATIKRRLDYVRLSESPHPIDFLVVDIIKRLGPPHEDNPIKSKAALQRFVRLIFEAADVIAASDHTIQRHVDALESLEPGKAPPWMANIIRHEVVYGRLTPAK
jgi:hypothetical protein